MGDDITVGSCDIRVGLTSRLSALRVQMMSCLGGVIPRLSQQRRAPSDDITAGQLSGIAEESTPVCCGVSPR